MPTSLLRRPITQTLTAPRNDIVFSRHLIIAKTRQSSLVKTKANPLPLIILTHLKKHYYDTR
jgi:hypothetical protein